MMYNLLQMANRAARNANLPTVQSDGITPTNFIQSKVASLNGYLNSRYKTLYEKLVPAKTMDIFNVTVSANAYEVTFPKYIGLIFRVVDNGTSSQGDSVYLIDPAAYSDKVVAIRNLFRTFLEFEEDTPCGTALGVSNVFAQPATGNPATAVTLTVKSSSTQDASGQTGAVTVFLRGMNQNMEVITESLTTNGTTGVNSSNYYLYLNVVSKTGPSVGIISVFDSTSNSLATINTWEVSPEYQRVKLEVAPTTPSQYNVTAQKAFVPMLNFADVPAFDCCEALVSGATQDIFIEGKQLEDAQQFAEKFKDDSNNLEKKYVETSGNSKLMLPCGYA